MILSIWDVDLFIAVGFGHAFSVKAAEFFLPLTVS